MTSEDATVALRARLDRFLASGDPAEIGSAETTIAAHGRALGQPRRNKRDPQAAVPGRVPGTPGLGQHQSGVE